jgi:hypothetical protein
MGIRDIREGKAGTILDEESGSAAVVSRLVSGARAAMESVSGYDQERVNEVVQAVAWAIIERAEELARTAVEDTGLGNVEDKVEKNQRKTPGTLRDLLGPMAGSVGIKSVDEEKGITEIANPSAWSGRSRRRPTRGRRRPTGWSENPIEVFRTGGTVRVDRKKRSSSS